MKSQLIKNNELINNDWVLIVPEISIENIKKQAGKVVQFKTTGEEVPNHEDIKKTILPEASKALIPLKLYLLKKTEIEKQYSEIGLWIYSHEEINLFEQLDKDINDFPVVGVLIEKFADGRIFSLGNLIRRKLKYKNDMRALGDILKDQLFFLKRSGFTSFLIKEGRDPIEATKGLSDFTYTYQGILNEPPLWKRR